MRILTNGNIAIGTPSANNPVNARVILDISGDDAIRIPSGRTNDRPNTFNDDYEADYMTRRVLTYTLGFTMKMTFYSSKGSQAVIKQIDIDF